MIRLQNVLKMSSRRICETSWRRFEDVLARRLEDVLKTSWKRLEDVLKTSWKRLEDVLKTSWRRLKDIWPRQIYWSWPRRLEDVFWRRMINKNIFVFIKTSWRRLLKMKTKDVLRSLQDVFIKTNVCWEVVLLLMTTPLIHLELQLVVIPFP